VKKKHIALIYFFLER